MSELICTCHCGGTMFYRHLHASGCACATQGDEAPESHPDTIATLRATIAQQAQELGRCKSEKNDAVIELYRKLDAKDAELAASQARCREMESKEIALKKHIELIQARLEHEVNRPSKLDGVMILGLCSLVVIVTVVAIQLCLEFWRQEIRWWP